MMFGHSWKYWSGRLQLGLCRACGLGFRFAKPEPPKAEPKLQLSGQAEPAHHYLLLLSYGSLYAYRLHFSSIGCPYREGTT